MATKLFLRDAASDINPGAETEKLASLTQGSSAVTKATNTQAGPIGADGIIATDGAGGASLAWYTNPLSAVTISGTVTINLRALESSMNANAGVQFRLERTNNAGVVQSIITEGEFGSELGTAESAWNWTKTPTSTALSGGDRLKITVRWNDVGTMASGFTCSLVYGGAAAATGDTWIQVNENLVEQTAPTIALNTADATDFGSDTTPTLEFTGTDAQGDDVRYNIQIHTDNIFRIIADSYSESNQSGFFGVSGGGTNSLELGQSFTGSANDNLYSVRLYLRKTGTPTGNATAKIYAHSGTYGTSSVPTGAALATSATLDVSTLSTSYQLIELLFTGANAIALSNGTNYVVALAFSGGSTSHRVDWGRDVSSSAHSGNLATYNGTTWSATSNSDFCFYVYTETENTLLNKISGTDAGFLNTVNGADTDPFTSGQKVSYTVQAGDALAAGTYYWRARASDPNGLNTYSAWATARTFTVSPAVFIATPPKNFNQSVNRGSTY